MKYKAIMGSAVMGITIILLTISGALTQAEIASMQTGYTTSISPYFYEEMKIVAGNDAAALIELLLIGGGTPDIASDSRFINVASWLFIASDQEDYTPYLLRRPFKAPENASLILEMKAYLGPAGSLTQALGLATLFGHEYGVSLMWSRVEVLPTGNYLYYFTGGMVSTIFNTLITEFKTDIASGFVNLLSGATVGASPVKAVVMGEGMVSGSRSEIRGVYYVDDDAITGTSDFTLSTAHIFGAQVTPYSGVMDTKYSVLKIRFPYTINPISITPRTDNFAPQITGKMDWILNSPWSLFARPPSDYVVVYNIDHSKLISTPKVSVNMAYDPDELQQNGRLQMDYVVKNNGNENATDIDISYSLGPDFLTFLASKPDLWDLRDDVYIDESAHIEITGTAEVLLNSGSIGSYSQIVLILEGWYRWLSPDPLINNTLVDFNSTLTNEIVGYESELLSGQPVEVIVSLSCPDGLSSILVARTTELLNLVSLTSYELGTIGNIIPDYSVQLANGVEAAGDDLFTLLYTAQSIFDPDTMDFSFSVREVGDVGMIVRDEVFLNTTIDVLQPGESKNVSWAIDNIPSELNHFGIMGDDTIPVAGDYPALVLKTVDKDGYELMRYLFGLGDPGPTFTYSRPLSFYEPWLGNWISVGARFSYSDPEGFEYFGFSNGINLQIADDEAVLNVYVDIENPAYNIGDPIKITYSIENTGNTVAQNLEIYLYHGRMGSDWQIKDAELFWYDEVASLAGGGEIYTADANVFANSFLGIHPVYAVVEFDSDVGQPAEIVNFGPGIYSIFEGAGETHQVVLSNMDWAMLLPDTTDRRPAFPQPVIQVDVSVYFHIPDNAPWELGITITITNVGDVETSLIAVQFYNASEMALLNRTTTKGNDYNVTHHGMGVVFFTGIVLLPGQSVVITMWWLFLTSHGCYIPGIIIVYTSRYENELDVDEDGVQPETDTEAPLLQAMDGEAQDDEDWEEYGQSTQTGSSAGADSFTGGDNTRRMGSFKTLYWSFGAVFVTAVATVLRKKTKK